MTTTQQSHTGGAKNIQAHTDAYEKRDGDRRSANNTPSQFTKMEVPAITLGVGEKAKSNEKLGNLNTERNTWKKEAECQKTCQTTQQSSKGCEPCRGSHS